MSFASAVREVCAPLEGDAPPLVYRLHPVEDAKAEDEPSELIGLLSGTEDLRDLPPSVAWARMAARDMKAAWLTKPHELARLMNSPGFPAEYDETKETPFEFSERTDRVGGPSTLAVPFPVAHELWGWGAVDAPASVADISPDVLADWPALMAYRKANRGKDWGRGKQLAIARAELERRTADGKTTESDALEVMAKELGAKGRETLRKALKTKAGDRMRVKKATPAATAATAVRDDIVVRRDAA